VTCRDFYSFLDEFLGQTLDVLTSQSFARHLEHCNACRKYLASYAATVKTARDAELKDLPARTPPPEALIQAILSARSAAFVRQPPE